MALNKRDGILLALGAVILLVLWAAPDESTKRIPNDKIHHKFYEMIPKEGKKAAEQSCGECHNKDGVPFPEKHPPKFRCLFCHKLEQ